MQLTIRRATALAAAALLGASGALVAPSMASANPALESPDVYGVAMYLGESEYGPVDNSKAVGFQLAWDAVGPTHVSGTTVKGYETRVLTGSPAFLDVVSQSSTSSVAAGAVIVTDLAVGQKYEGAVRAVYNIDNGSDPDTTDYSEWKYTSVSSALKPAPAPLSVTAKASAAGTVTVTWKAPSIPALTESVVGYEIAASPELDFEDIFAGGDPQFEYYGTSVAPDRRTAKITGLRPGTTYEVGVATLGSGPGGEDGFSMSYGGSAYTTVTALGAPAKPTKLKVKTLKRGASKVSWTGAKATKAGPVTGYKVYVNGKFKKTVGKSVRSYTAKGQKAGKRYTYTVKAYNAVASSSAATISKKRPKS